MQTKINNQFGQEFLAEHIKFMRMLAYIAGFIFLGWALLVGLMEDTKFEIWPIRIGVSASFWAIGFISLKKNYTLQQMDWSFSVVGSLGLTYAFYISWLMGLHPTWITGSTLIILGVLNFLTYKGPAFLFAGLALVLSVFSFVYNDVVFLMNPGSVFVNFLTATVLGLYSSWQRNSFLTQVIKSEDQQHNILNTMSEGVILHDKTGRIVASNPSAHLILGLTESQMLGKSNIDPMWCTYNEDNTVCPPENHPSARAQREGKAILNFIIHLQKTDASWAWLEISAVPMIDPGHTEPRGTLVTLRDITSFREALATVEAQKESLFATSKLSALGEMSAGIAHEINNPLAVIMGSANQLKRHLRNGSLDLVEFEKRTDTILRTTERISKIISSMRSLSRQNDNDETALTDVAEIISDVLEVCQDGLKHNGISLSVEISENLSISCHRGQIGQVILNLINNARDAVISLEQKWIKVEGSQTQDGQIELRIRDSGPGIPEDLRAKIMRPFFTTKEIGKGTGLGLSLVRSIMLSHHGQVRIDETYKNTCFVLKFPPVQSIQLFKNKTA